MSFDLATQLASVRQRRAVIALSVAVCLAFALAVPVAGVRWAEMRHVAGIYGAAAAMIHLATFWLLISAHKPSYAHRIVAAAYLYAGLMAILHVLTFPGALLADASVLGNSNTVSWLYIAWRAGFPLFVLWAVLSELRANRPRRRAAAPFSPVYLALLAAVAALGAALAASEVSALVPAAGGTRFSTPSVWGAYFCAVVSLAVIVLVWRSGLARRSLYLWLIPVLLSESLGVWLSTFSGGRYTVAWYVARIEGVLAGAVVLALLAHHMRQLQNQLAASVEQLRQRTDALQAEMQHRELAERKLVQSQKLEAVGQLAAGLAHDINNFMQTIGVRSELIKRRAGAAVEADVAIVQRNVKRVEHLTRQLLLVAGRRQLSPQPVQLQNVLPDIAEAFRPLLGSSVSLDLSVATDAWCVDVDPTELEVALTNLLTNARDAMDGGGTITVSACNAPRAGGAPDAVIVEVRDPGRGVAAAVLERVFEPFFTTKAPGKGTGLGLAQVDAFVRGSGGKVTLHSEQGKGTTVRIELPRHIDKAVDGPHAASAPAMVPVQHRAGAVVLLVDDNADVLESTSLLLEQAGLAVTTAGDAAQALALLAAGLQPHVLLSDIVMPGSLDGLALARLVRRRHPALRVVLASGYSAAANEARAEGFAVLQKPYDADALLAVIVRGG